MNSRTQPGVAIRLWRAEQTGRTEDQDHDQDHEDEGLAPRLAGIRATERTHEPDDKPTENRAGNVANAAENRGCEGIHSVLESMC